MSSFDTQTLVDRVKLFEFMANSQQTFSDQDIIDLANVELSTELTKAVTDCREDFFVHFGTPFTPTGSEIAIPNDGIGLRLKDVWRVDGSGFALPVPRIELHQVPYYYPAPWSMYPGQGAYYLAGNKIILYPPNAFNGFMLQLIYFKRPAELVLPSAAAAISSSSAPGLIGTAGLPTTWVIGDMVDLISGDYPFEPKAFNVEILNISGSDVIVDDDVRALAVPGDYLALHGQSPVVQYFPLEAYPLLTQLTANRCLQALGDQEAMQFAVAKAKAMREALTSSLMPRVENRPKKIVSTNSPQTAARWSSYWGF